MKLLKSRKVKKRLGWTIVVVIISLCVSLWLTRGTIQYVLILVLFLLGIICIVVFVGPKKDRLSEYRSDMPYCCADCGYRGFLPIPNPITGKMAYCDGCERPLFDISEENEK